VGAGTCVPRPQDCITPENIVCGCDGKLYRSECDANASGGVDTKAIALCPTPPGMFQCGTLFCAHGTQYCRVTTREGSSSNAYACVDLPGGCTQCACLLTAACYGCGVPASGDMTVMCAAS